MYQSMTYLLKNCCFSFIIIATMLLICGASRVLELSDKFSDIRNTGGQWLVMFYAPWCGHCKRLEPIWAHVAQALAKTNIRVGRVDCTRFTSLAHEFSINGFPTIKYVRGEESHTFLGDRTKEEIVDFALRMSGPAVQQITQADSLRNIKNTNKIFFMYVGPPQGSLWDAYNSAASALQPYGFFYSTNYDIAKEHVQSEPAVFVHKESTQYLYPGLVDDIEAENLNNSLYTWMNEERFLTFPKVTKGNISQILQTRKYLVFVVVEENKLQEIPADMLEFRDMVESIIKKHREKYHKVFQFGWIGSPDLANSIAMTELPLPHLLVLNSTTNHHHLPEDEPSQLTAEAIHIFLDRIVNQTAPVYGGNSLLVRVYRTYFEARTSLSDMWRGNPVLTTLLFGLPLGFLSLILYSICCSDILDAEEEEEELLHEKKE